MTEETTGKKNAGGKKIKIWLFSMFSVLVILASFFFTWIIHSDFTSNYKEIQQQYYELTCGQLINNMENSIKYGKEIDRFYGMDTIFDDIYQYISPSISAYILRPNGQKLYRAATSQPLSGDLFKDGNIVSALANEGNTRDTKAFSMDGGGEAIIMPIFNDSGVTVGNMRCWWARTSIRMCSTRL